MSEETDFLKELDLFCSKNCIEEGEKHLRFVKYHMLKRREHRYERELERAFRIANRS